MKSRVSLRDIATRINVHVSTVSLALRDSPRLPKATRERIQQAAREMGYRPDPMLEALAAYRDQHRRRTRLLASITDWDVPVTQVSHYRSFHRGAVQRANELGFLLENFRLTGSGMTPSRLTTVLTTRNIEGVVLSAYQHGLDRLELDWDRFCAVRIELQPTWPPVHSFAVDHIRSLREAMTRIRELGYRKPGLVIGLPWSEMVEDHWEMAYLWEQRTLPPEQRVPSLGLRLTGSTLDHRRQEFNAWFTKHRPDVVLGPSGMIEDALRVAGLRCPEDVAVVDPFQEEPHPFFAGVVHHLEEVGKRAVEALAAMLMHNMRGIPAVATRSYVDSRWQGGASCPRRLL